MSDELTNTGGGQTETQRKAQEQARMAGGPRMGSAAVPVERSRDLRNSTLRMLSWMRPDWFKLTVVFVLAVASVVLFVIGPKILGNATNEIVRGVTSPEGIDYPALHRTLLVVTGLYVGSAVLAYAQGLMLAGIIHRAMRRVRAAVEDKINSLPLGHIDRSPAW